MEPFAAILKRVEEKKKDYANYGFAKLEMAALNTFFDLAQEYDGLENLYLVSVTVPKVFLDLECKLYTQDTKSDALHPVAGSSNGFEDLPDAAPSFIQMRDTMYRHERSYVFPIIGKKTPASRILLQSVGDVLGVFEVVSEKGLTEDNLFFVQKYVNRIGYNLFNKLLAEQNFQHLKFINNLVADIEHNVIVPNMRYKAYFRTIRRYQNTNKEIEKELENILQDIKGTNPDLYAKLTGLLEWIVVANRSVFDEQEKIERHYKHASLFLESLFRRDHFLFGQYMLRKGPCRVWGDIIIPQLERYADRLKQQGIALDHIFGRPGEIGDLEIKVDKGLLAQVMANLFSNLVKYTESMDDGKGTARRIDCDARLESNFFGKGFHGIRVQVFSSGPPINEKVSERIFDEGFRLNVKESVEGTGHGLYFIKNVIEVHGGIVGHRSEKYGNHFYFVVPA